MPTQTSYLNKNVGTTPQTIATITATTALVGVSAANVSIAPVTVDIYVTRSGVDYYQVKAVPVPLGSTIPIVGGVIKHFLLNGDVLKVVASAANAVDVTTSVSIGV